MVGGAGKDLMFGDDGDDLIMSGAGNDMVFGGAGRDRIITEEGDDVIDGGDDRDIVDAGAGNDTVLAAFEDGDDVYDGGEGTDLLDLSAITSDAVVDLGEGAFGQVESEQSGVDSIASFENVIGGFGNDTIIANNSVNVVAGGAGQDNFVFNSASAADGDHVTDFQAGDKIDLRGIASNYDFGGDGNFDVLENATTFTQAGQVILRSDGDDVIVEGNVDNDAEADFAIRISGKSDLNSSDFVD